MKTPADGWADEERDLPEDLARELSRLGGAATAPPIEVLRAAGTGVLPDDLEQAAQAYLSRTPHARALVEELNDAASLDPHSEARVYARIAQESGAARAPRVASRWMWRAAAAIGAVAVAGSMWSIMTRDRAEGPAVAVTEPPQAPAATNKPAAGTPETFLLPLQRPDVRISLRALTWRGSERANPILTALKPALDAFRAGDYQRANDAFAAIDKQYPKLVEVGLYRGVSRLFLGDIAGATANLQDAAALRDAAFANDIEWYLAIAEERSGQRAAARARVEALCRGGAGDARACAALARQ